MKNLKTFLYSKNYDSEAMLKKFDIYFNLLIEYNKLFNLTAITEKPEVENLHFIDSLACVSIIKNNIADIGTGAGFPSIPLSIVREDCNFLLVDSLKKRINFLETVKKELDLKNVELLHSRAEDLDRKRKFDFVVARAVAPLNILSEYCLPFVKINGKFIAYKSVKTEEEIESSKKALFVLGGRVEKIEEYTLPSEGEVIRKLIIINKEKECDKIYPRAGNKPRSMPLI